MEQPLLAVQIDQAGLVELQQQVKTQLHQLQEQTHRIQQLEAELTEARLTLARVPQLDERLDRMKNEFLQVFEERYGRPQPGVASLGQCDRPA